MSSSLKASDIRDVAVWIYGLVDPTDGVVRYVGKSANPAARLTNHEADGAEAVAAWVAELAVRGLRPALVRLHRVEPGEDASVFESERIEHFDTHGLLLNSNKPSTIAPRAGRTGRRVSAGPRTKMGARFSEGAHLLSVVFEASGISQRQFGELIGADASMISRWMYGDSKPSVEWATVIQARLGIPIATWSAAPVDADKAAE